MSGLAGEYLDIEIVSDLRTPGDLSLRFNAELNSGNSIFTDLNGHNMQHHKFQAKLHTQGNFFPMPSAAFIQDNDIRLTLLGSEPHGVASLEEGG